MRKNFSKYKEDAIKRSTKNNISTKCLCDDCPDVNKRFPNNDKRIIFSTNSDEHFIKKIRNKKLINKWRKKNNIKCFIFLNLLFIFELIYPILSDLIIHLDIYIYKGYYYNIINIKCIGKPNEIYLNDKRIEDDNNFDYKYENNYLKFKSFYGCSRKVTLIWKSTITKGSSFDGVKETNIINEKDVNTNASDKISEISEELESQYIIPENFTLNAYEMFKNCPRMKKIDFIDFDTNIIINMSHMFDSCKSLKEVINFAPVNSQDMSFLFYNCYSLEKIDFIFPDSMISERVMNMENMFFNCSSLKYFNFTNIITKRVLNMNSMFFNCTTLNSLDFGNNFDLSSVTDLGSMFYNCSSLTSIDLIGSNKSPNLENIDKMFHGCESLKSLNLNFDVSNVINMEYLFYNCKNLDSLDLCNFKAN